MSAFGFQSTTDEVCAGVDLSGKQAVITGASSGLGVETARALAQCGAAVLMVARDAQKLDAAAAQVREAVPGASVDTALLDLADLDSVRAGAADILARAPSIDLLINNAGVMACPLLRTAQGFEMQFGTNHLGHFLLTGLLAPALVAAAPSRVINLSSAGHRFAPVDMDDPNYTHRDYEKWQSYGQSKTANALFSVGLDRRLQDRGVRAFAVHPGMIMTELSRHMVPEDFTQDRPWSQARGAAFQDRRTGLRHQCLGRHLSGPGRPGRPLPGGLPYRRARRRRRRRRCRGLRPGPGAGRPAVATVRRLCRRAF